MNPKNLVHDFYYDKTKKHDATISLTIEASNNDVLDDIMDSLFLNLETKRYDVRAVILDDGTFSIKRKILVDKK